jgi:hypothetical protein
MIRPAVPVRLLLLLHRPSQRVIVLVRAPVWVIDVCRALAGLQDPGRLFRLAQLVQQAKIPFPGKLVSPVTGLPVVDQAQVNDEVGAAQSVQATARLAHGMVTASVTPPPALPYCRRITHASMLCHDVAAMAGHGIPTQSATYGKSRMRRHGSSRPGWRDVTGGNTNDRGGRLNWSRTPGTHPAGGPAVCHVTVRDHRCGWPSCGW